MSHLVLVVHVPTTGLAAICLSLVHVSDEIGTGVGVIKGVPPSIGVYVVWNVSLNAGLWGINDANAVVSIGDGVLKCMIVDVANVGTDVTAIHMLLSKIIWDCGTRW